MRNALDLPAVMACVIVATLPCVAWALYNTGHQANRALARVGAGASPAWRARALELLGAGQEPGSIWDCSLHGASYLLPLLLVALGSGFVAERAFAALRRRPQDPVALPVIALLFTLCLPPTLPLWQAALGCAVGVAVGKEIFGGFGRNVVNPALTGLAFLYFAYPGSLTGEAVWVAVDGWSAATPLGATGRGGAEALAASGLSWWGSFTGRVPGALGATSPLACLLGLAVLLYTGVASWRIPAGGLAGLLAGALLFQAGGASQPIAELSWQWHAVSGGFAFGMVFLATDPVTSPATDPARWLYGALIGFLVVAIRVANPAHREGVMLAILFGNLAAPLLDQVAVRLSARVAGLRRAG